MDDVTRTTVGSRLGLRDRVALHAAHAVTGVFLAIGILTALRGGLDRTENLVVFRASPGAALAWIAIGLVGAGMVTTPVRARLYLRVAGPLLLAWAVACLALDGAGSDMFLRDPQTVALYAGAGAISLAAALAPARATRPTTPSGDAPGSTP